MKRRKKTDNLGDGYNNKAESVKHSSHVDCYYYE